MESLTIKEKSLLEGEVYQHQLAIDKYNNYSIHSKDETLKKIFCDLKNIEENHLSLINLMLQGVVPKIDNPFTHPYYDNYFLASNDYITIGDITLTSMNDTFSYDDSDKIICFDALNTEELIYSTSLASSLEFKNTSFQNCFEYIINQKNENIKYLNEYIARCGMNNNIIQF